MPAKRCIACNSRPENSSADDKDVEHFGGQCRKIAPHHEGQPIHPDLLSKEIFADEIDQMRNILNDFFNIQAVFNYSDVCMYTNTPDGHFIIDYYPSSKNIIIASPCSGHGFKFSSAVGKILSDMATGVSLDFDISPFNMKRFKNS